jgi:NTE family protein
MRAQSTFVGTVAVALLCALFIAGCASVRDDEPLTWSPRLLRDLAPVTPADPRRPTVALVLGGGGLRGFAHLGVLRALEEAGIQPDIVVGSSAGAVVGAAYASGLSSVQIEVIAGGLRVSSLIDFTVSASGIMRGDHIARWINTFTAGAAIESFPRRFAAVATDLESGNAMLLDQGSPGRAVQASAAVPGINVPVAYRGGHLVDGSITSLVPVRAARAMGADVVIAVDIFCQGPGSDGLGAPAILVRAMHVQTCLLAQPEMAEADVLIASTVCVPGMSANDEQRVAIEAGYVAASAALARIKQRLAA